MGKNPSIRITKSDRQEYSRLVRNAKAKIRRTAENYNLDLRSEIPLPSLDDITSRKQFNEIKAQIRSFTNRNNQQYQFKKNEYGVVASKRELREIELDTKRAQAIVNKLIEEAENKPFISGGKEQGTVGQRMKQMARPNAAGLYAPPDFNFNKIRSRSDLLRKKKAMKERADEHFFDKRMEQMKINFMDILSKSLHSNADELIEKLQAMPADDFYEMYLMFDEFDFDLWDSERMLFDSHDEAIGHISKMLSYVDRYYAGKLNMDLKGF